MYLVNDDAFYADDDQIYVKRDVQNVEGGAKSVERSVRNEVDGVRNVEGDAKSVERFPGKFVCQNLHTCGPWAGRLQARSTAQPLVAMSAHEIVVGQMRIGAGHAINFLGLAGAECFLRVETPNAFE